MGAMNSIPPAVGSQIRLAHRLTHDLAAVCVKCFGKKGVKTCIYVKAELTQCMASEANRGYAPTAGPVPQLQCDLRHITISWL